MCITPNSVWVQRGSKWEQQPMACRQCWRCKENRVNDYIARGMAEASTSTHSCTLNLTYAPRDDLADKVLNPRHFQLFMKLLRRRGHLVRYLVAGEYGETKGRAHFHAVLFFTEIKRLAQDDPKPAYQPDDLAETNRLSPFSRQVPQKRMVHIREWPHGHITCDWSASEKSIRYVCKYLLQDDKNNAWFSLSKKPALGAAWFAQKAATAKTLSVLPHSFEYQPPGASPDKRYLMTGASRRDYLAAITTDKALRPRMSEWVQKTFDKHALGRMKKSADMLMREVPEESWYFFVSEYLERLWHDHKLERSKIDHYLQDELKNGRFVQKSGKRLELSDVKKQKKQRKKQEAYDRAVEAVRRSGRGEIQPDGFIYLPNCSCETCSSIRIGKQQDQGPHGPNTPASFANSTSEAEAFEAAAKTANTSKEARCG